MNQLNQVIIEGNVVRVVDIKTTPKGKRVCTFPIATNRYYKDALGNDVEESTFVDVEAWESVCDSVEKYAAKGRGLRVVGRLKQNRWKTPDGKQASKIFVIADHIEFKPLKSRDAPVQADDAMKGDAKIAMESVAEELGFGTKDDEDLAF